MAIHPPRKRSLPPPRPADVSRYHGARMTEEEYLSLPEEKPYLEYVYGVVLQKPMPNNDHSTLAFELAAEIALYRRQHGGYGGIEGRVRLRGDTGYFLPDVAYWARGRPSGDDSIPTLAVEVRSPSQTMAEQRRKCRDFRASGVDVCWLIDPVSRRAEVFEGDRDAELLPVDGVLESEHLPGFSLPLPALFAVLDEQRD